MLRLPNVSVALDIGTSGDMQNMLDGDNIPYSRVGLRDTHPLRECVEVCHPRCSIKRQHWISCLTQLNDFESFEKVWNTAMAICAPLQARGAPTSRDTCWF